MTLTVQEKRVAAQRESPAYTPAQRVRQACMQRRRLKNDSGLSPFRAVLESCILTDEVRERMAALHTMPEEKLFVAVVVRHVDGEFLKFRTILLDPSPGGISAVMEEIGTLNDPKVLGCVFRLYDLKAGVSRDWARPFVPGEVTRQILLRALREQSKKSEAEMSWVESTRKLTPIALRISIAWVHPENHKIVLLPLEDNTLASSMAETELRAEGFGPVQVVALVPDNANGLEIRAIPMWPLGSAERIVAASFLPAIVQAFSKQAKADGIAGEEELGEA